jgi:hypothetical protein
MRPAVIARVSALVPNVNTSEAAIAASGLDIKRGNMGKFHFGSSGLESASRSNTCHGAAIGIHASASPSAKTSPFNITHCGPLSIPPLAL